MRVVLQLTSFCKVEIDGITTADIDKGFLLLLGVKTATPKTTR